MTANYPAMIAPTDHIEPAPRRVRGMLAGAVVLDTRRAVYVWEWPNYPQYYLPLDDFAEGALVDEDRTLKLKRGPARSFGLRAGDVSRAGTVRAFTDGALKGMARVDWDAFDGWYEEDEEIFVHPRNPYARVDAIRSSTRVRIELEGVVLADSCSPVLVFETGLPTRYYLDRLDVNFEHLAPSSTQTACPYKGRTTGYWSVQAGGELHEDLAWCYDFPTRQLLPIAGMVAFYDERVDVHLDGVLQERPVTHFFKSPSKRPAKP